MICFILLNDTERNVTLVSKNHLPFTALDPINIFTNSTRRVTVSIHVKRTRDRVSRQLHRFNGRFNSLTTFTYSNTNNLHIVGLVGKSTITDGTLRSCTKLNNILAAIEVVTTLLKTALITKNLFTEALISATVILTATDLDHVLLFTTEIYSEMFPGFNVTTFAKDSLQLSYGKHINWRILVD